MALVHKHYSRRTVLRGLLGGAGVAIALPIFDAFLNDTGTAFADGSALPKRFGIFFWGNGILPDRWVPKGNGPEWELSEQLAPLAPVKEHLTIVTGMKVYTGNSVPHGSGPVGMLSGAPFPSGDTTTFAVPSIDQVIAAEIGGETRFRSLEVAVQPGGTSLSYNGPHSVNPPESSPKALFDRLFGDEFVAPGDSPIVDPRLALRRSILDAIGEDAKRLQKVLGASDKARLEQHLEGIRGLEKQLKKLEENPPNLAACEAPKAPAEAYPEKDGRHPLSKISRAMADILAMALACDQTRVFSDWFSQPVNNLLYPDADKGHHQLTHDEPGAQPMVNGIVKYIVAELGYLLERFASVKEGDGTLLDKCVILATTDCSYGKAHSIEEYPILLAGGGGGALVKGVHYRSPSSENTSKVLLSLCRVMGLARDEYGEAEGKVTSGLSAIEA